MQLITKPYNNVHHQLYGLEQQPCPQAACLYRDGSAAADRNSSFVSLTVSDTVWELRILRTTI